MYASKELIFNESNINKAGYLIKYGICPMIVTCKESALTYGVEGEIAYKILQSESSDTCVANFRKLEGLWGISTDVKVVKHDMGDFLVLTDTWYNKNFFTEELGRVLISYCRKNFNSLEHFLDNCRFKNYDPCYCSDQAMRLKRYYAFLKNPFDIINSLTEAEIQEKKVLKGIFSSLFLGKFDDKLDL